MAPRFDSLTRRTDVPQNSPQEPTVARFARARRLTGKSRWADQMPLKKEPLR